MFCPKCGTKNEAKINYCAACGAKMVDNQPAQPTVSFDSVREIVNRQLPKTKEGVGQLLTKTKAFPKSAKRLSIAALALIVLVIAGFSIVSALTGPENIVKGYFEAKTKGDWDKMYDYWGLEDSEFVNKTSFAKYMEDADIPDIVNFEVINDSINGLTADAESDFIKAYTVKYILRGSSTVYEENITLIKRSGKKFLFFNDYIINVGHLDVTSDYQVYVPKDAAVFIDDIAIKQTYRVASDETTDQQYDTYSIPEIFSGIHMIRVEHPSYETYTESIYIDPYSDVFYAGGYVLREEEASDNASNDVPSSPPSAIEIEPPSAESSMLSPNPTSESLPNIVYDDYILPFSSIRALTDDDLQNLSKEELRLARNELYARYGRQFSALDLQEYFDGKSWYAGLPKLPIGEEPTLTALELSNAEMIKAYEER